MKELNFELAVGLHLNGEVSKNVELLKTNGVAEKVFVKKLSEKPFTWQGNILSVAIKSIGEYEVGVECRKDYQQNGVVTIPMVIKKLTLADVNSALVEIHRRCWVSFIPKQEIGCKYCGKKLMVDIDLDKIDFLPEVKEAMEAITDYSKIEVVLGDGFQPVHIPKISDKPEYAGLTDTVFTKFVFRQPLLEDAIKNEAYFSDSIGFWRRVAMDCLVSIDEVVDGEVVGTLPTEFFTYYGLKIFNEYLSGVDLRSIRTALQEHLPTLPFAYYEPCGCDRQLDIPMIMEASNFFSE
jgi:hypothetical protein